MGRYGWWITAALLGACGDGSSLDPCQSSPTFANQIRPIVTSKCLGCHSERLIGSARNGPPDALNFDTYDLIEPERAIFADAITSGREPPPNLVPPLTTTREERALVAKWRSCSYPP